MVDKCIFTSNVFVAQFIEAVNLQAIAYFHIIFYSDFSKKLAWFVYVLACVIFLLYNSYELVKLTTACMGELEVSEDFTVTSSAMKIGNKVNQSAS